MMSAGAIAFGVILAVPYVMFASRTRDYAWPFGLGLVAAAFVYVGFAAVALDVRQLAVELGGLFLFGIVTVLGVRYSPYLLAGGWIAHVGWDVLLRSPSNLPWWYPPACVGFDLLVAGAILGLTVRAHAQS
jgi:hypothetical protein